MSTRKSDDRRPTSRGGVEITDELAEQIADEAEAGYDLDRGRMVDVGRGRPSLSARGTSPQVTFRLSAELRARAEERAEREGKSLSDLAREALERHLS